MSGSSMQEELAQYPLLEALTRRRSRRFGLGMETKRGPLAFRSRHSPVALSEEEEALLVFAACGITGHALLDLTFGSGLGGSIVARSKGRTIASGDAIQTDGMVLTNARRTRDDAAECGTDGPGSGTRWLRQFRRA
jgi:hypothetical protein